MFFEKLYKMAQVPIPKPKTDIPHVQFITGLQLARFLDSLLVDVLNRAHLKLIIKIAIERPVKIVADKFHGRVSSFSIEIPMGVRFLIKSKMFTKEQLDDSEPIEKSLPGKNLLLPSFKSTPSTTDELSN